MKRYIVLFFALIFICCPLLSTVAQEPEFAIKAEEISASAGDTVAVKFSFENNPGISLFTLAIDYDEDRLELKQINGNSLMGGSFSCNVSERFVLWINSSGDSTFEGTVFTAIFEVKADADSGQAAVSVSLPNQDDNILNYNGDSITAQILSGYVDVQNSICYGDANNDGDVNAADLVAIRTIIISSATVDDKTKSICDVNADGAIDVIDLIRLKKYLAGANVTLG